MMLNERAQIMVVRTTRHLGRRRLCSRTAAQPIAGSQAAVPVTRSSISLMRLGLALSLVSN
jgi:hypothetical protein